MQWRFTLINAIYGTSVIDEPIGWSDISINVKRDMISHGLFFEHVVSLKFIDSGRLYLKNAYELGGIDQYVELKIEVKCSETDSFSDFYLGKIFLAKLIFDCSDYCFAECPIEPAGCLMKFRNRIDQKVNLQLCEDYDKNVLPCYNFLPYTIKMKPKLVVKKSVGSSCYEDECYISEEYKTPAGTGNSIVIEKDYYFQPCIGALTLNEVNVTSTTGLFWSESESTIDKFLQVAKTGLYKIKLRFNFDLYSTVFASTESVVCVPTGGVCGPELKYEFSICGNPGLYGSVRGFDRWEVDGFITVNGAVVYSSSYYSAFSTCFGADLFSVLSTTAQLLNQCFDADLSLNLSAGDVVKAFVKVKQAGDFKLCLSAERRVRFVNVVKIHEDSNCLWKFEIISETLGLPTDSKVYMINEAFSRVTENITNDCMRVKSNYFGRTDSQPYTSLTDGCGALESLTVGKHLRQFPDNLCLMNPSFKDLFENMNAIHNIGYGIEPDANRMGFEWLRIEPMAYWYDNTVLMVCDNIPDMKRRVMAEWYMSLFNFGYEKWEAEQTSGLDEFAVKKQYRTTFKEIKNEVNQRVKFIGSGYAIENTRSETYLADATKDWRWDNEIFIICVRRDGSAAAPYSLISVEQGVDCINVATATNIIDPATIYNARISPNRNFLRWLPHLMANYSFDINNPLSYFRFVDGEGNYLAEMELINGCLYEKSGENLKENEDISTADTNTVNQSKPIFKFELIDFEYPMSFSEFNNIKSNPRGIIEYRGTDMTLLKKGYIYSISYKPNTGIATFALLPKYI